MNRFNLGTAVCLLLTSLIAAPCPDLSGRYLCKGQTAQIIVDITQDQCKALEMTYKRRGEIVLERHFNLEGWTETVPNMGQIRVVQTANWDQKGLSYTLRAFYDREGVSSYSIGSLYLERNQLIENIQIFRSNGTLHSTDSQVFVKLQGR